MQVRPIKTRIFKEGEDLIAFIKRYVPRLKEGSILVVTSKIVALAEGRTAGMKDLKKVVNRESDWSMRARFVYLTMKDGMLLANAGVDASNGSGKIVLLPKDSFRAAQHIRAQLKKHYKLRKLGIAVSDSRCAPLRRGVVGVAIGYAGFRALRNYTGKKDIFGRKFRFTQTDVADSLATTAVLTMGEGSERHPLAIVEDAPVEFTNRVNRKELLISFEEDMYRPLFRRAL